MEEKEHVKLLSICITSYNRVEELLRCLNSINLIDKHDIEIVVSEDHSEKRDKIASAIVEWKKTNKIELIYNSNNVNLGYDKNLQKLISLSHGKYILFISDDDSFLEGSLVKIIESLKEKEYSLIFSPFLYKNTWKRYYANSFHMGKGIDNANHYIYDSILFSGLLFRREYVSSINAERFLNCNYFQVYLFIYVIVNYGADYLNIPLIQCNEDGENAFGRVTSSSENKFLADRKSIFSNLEFHKGLIRVLRIFEQDFSVDIITHFSKEYCLRSYLGMSIARAQGLRIYQTYWKFIKTLDIRMTRIIYLYYTLLLLFGEKFTNKIISVPKFILKFYREKRNIY